MPSIRFHTLKGAFSTIDPSLAHQICWINGISGSREALYFLSTETLENFCVVLDFSRPSPSISNILPLRSQVVYNVAEWDPETRQIGLAGRVDANVSFIEIFSYDDQQTKYWIERHGEFIHNFAWFPQEKFTCSLLGENAFLMGKAGRVTKKISVTIPGFANIIPPRPIRFITDPRKKLGYYSDGTRVLEIDFRKKRSKAIFAIPDTQERITHLQLDHAFNVLFVLTNAGTIRWYDLTEKETIAKISVPPRPTHFLFHSGLEKIVTYSQDGLFTVVNLEDARIDFSRHIIVPVDETIQTLSAPISAPIDLSWSHEGDRILGSYMQAPGVLLDVNF